MNYCSLVGNLTKDLKREVLPSGAIKVTGRIAVNGGRPDRRDAAFIPFQVWNGVAEYLYNNASEKGSKVGMYGHLVTEEPYMKGDVKIFPETYLKVEGVDVFSSTKTSF